MKFLSKLGIRGKILALVALFLVFLFIIEAIIFYKILLGGFNAVEERDMIIDVQRVEGLIKNEIKGYSVKIADWASWDDTYNFIIDKNQAYKNSNLTSTSLANIKLNFMIFIASGGAIVEERGVNYQTKEYIPIPKDLHDLLSKPNVITVHKTIESESSGIIRLTSGNIIFASKPILNSFGKGPIRGTLVFARYIDKPFLDTIAELERSKVSIKDYYSDSLPKDFSDAKKYMKTKGVQHKEPNGDIDYYYINFEGNDSIDGFTFIYDINKNPAFIIENQLERPYFALGKELAQFSLGIFAVFSLISIVLAYIMFNKLVISKIGKLNKDVSLISDPSNVKTKLEVKGNDEFSVVALNINKMLDYIAKSEDKLKMSEEGLIKEKEVLNKKVTELERFNQLTIGRELKMIELKKEIARLEAEKGGGK